MNHPRALGTIPAVFCACLISSNAHSLANRVFVSARSGNDANTCDNILAPCQTFGTFGVLRAGSGTVETRTNNTITGNAS